MLGVVRVQHACFQCVTLWTWTLGVVCAIQTAGIVGSKTYGVAKKVKLVSARIFDCEGRGSWAGNLAAIAWVANQRTTAVSATTATH